MRSKTNRGLAVLAIFISSGYAIIIATGLLAIGIAVTAGMKGYSLEELYVETFPTFRGGEPATRLPKAVYTIFFAYVIAAAEIAILYRRRLAKRWFGR
jgi:hypothetical protein